MKTAHAKKEPGHTQTRARWFNRTVLGIGAASLFSDWSHETATAVLPSFLASMGAAAAWLGLIEGVSDGLSSFAKMASGYYTDRMARRKPIAVAGYVTTTLATGAIGMASAAWQVLFARSLAWLGRGVRTPVRKALLAAGVMAVTIMLAPLTVPTLAAVFVLGGIYVAVEETLEDSLCAELASEEQHGMAFGTLATVNGVGDFASSLVVGVLWSSYGTTLAFGYCACLFAFGALMVAHLKPAPGRTGAR